MCFSNITHTLVCWNGSRNCKSFFFLTHWPLERVKKNIEIRQSTVWIGQWGKASWFYQMYMFCVCTNMISVISYTVSQQLLLLSCKNYGVCTEGFSVLLWYLQMAPILPESFVIFSEHAKPWSFQLKWFQSIKFHRNKHQSKVSISTLQTSCTFVGFIPREEWWAFLFAFPHGCLQKMWNILESLKKIPTKKVARLHESDPRETDFNLVSTEPGRWRNQWTKVWHNSICRHPNSRIAFLYIPQVRLMLIHPTKQVLFSVDRHGRWAHDDSAAGRRRGRRGPGPGRKQDTPMPPST